MVLAKGPKGALVGAGPAKRRSTEKVIEVVKCPIGDPPRKSFEESPCTSGELIGSGPEGAGPCWIGKSWF